MVWQEQDGVKICVAPSHEPSSAAARDELPHQKARRVPSPPVNPPFDRRELAAMQILAGIGVDKPICFNKINNAGPSTFKKLSDRGYAKITHENGSPVSEDRIALTKKGLADWKALERYRGRS